MFYSHQLLSKKGPFGQIWIAATVQPKMNRKRTDQVDIQESCMQIINPVVPLALRLSGILMGGIVRIYNHKVKFLYDDVTEFMLKVKTKPVSLRSEDNTRLPQKRSRAKFEAITIDGTEETFHDFERAMLEPETPDQDDSEFFTVPPPKTRTSTSRGEKFQAENEDITLNEDSVRSFTTVLDEEESADRFQQPETFIDDGITMDPFYEGLEPITEERDVDQRDNEIDGEKGPKSPEPQKPRKRRKTSKRPKKLVYDAELTEIPAHVFQSWLQDSSNIIYRRHRRKRYTQVSAERSKVLLSSPSTFLSCGIIPKSLLPPPVLDMWKRTLETPASVKPPPAKAREGRESPDESPAPAMEKTPEADESPPPPLEFVNFDEPERFAAPFNFENYGSVEKLRAAVRTPVTDGGIAFDNQTGFTPTISGNSVLNSKRKKSSPSIDKLVPDVVGDHPTSVRSKKSRASERKSDSPFGAEFYNDYLPEERTPDITLLPSEFEATQAAQAYQRDLDKLTSIMLQYLREHFISAPLIKSLSLDSLTEGMDTSQAAKMFFHICVLASNSYLSVLQKEAYGDIIVGRGRFF